MTTPAWFKAVSKAAVEAYGNSTPGMLSTNTALGMSAFGKPAATSKAMGASGPGTGMAATMAGAGCARPTSWLKHTNNTRLSC